MKGIIDRIEEGIAVVEVDGKMYNVRVSLEFNEGDVVDIIIEDEKIVSIKKNDDSTAERKKYIEELTKNMWK